MFLVFKPVLAQINTVDQFGLNPVSQSIGLAQTDIRLIIARIIRAVLGLLGIIVLVLIIYAGFLIMTSEGNEEKMAQGKKIITNAVVGLVIILSSYAIAQFIINSLADATGINQGGEQQYVPKEFFYGSGALGKVVKDHYPFRDQTGIKRNTKIVVTFSEPMDPASIIENSNRTCFETDNNLNIIGGVTTTCKTLSKQAVTLETDLADIANPYYGDCIVGTSFDWARDCDHLNTKAVQVYPATSATELVEAVALTTYEDGGSRNAYTYVFKPIIPQFLGSESENVDYTVKLTNEIKKKNKVNGTDVGAFNGQYASYYSWNFQTDTNLDFSPPFVERVSPMQGETVARNKIIQIDFSEPVDPTVVQGMSGAKSAFSHIIFNTTTIEGQWKVSNGYKTVEFVSSLQCGKNSCGEPMYCLPLQCDPKDSTCKQDFSILTRTALLLNENNKSSFEGLPFSGVMDLSGNAMDNGPGNKEDLKIANPHRPVYDVNNQKVIGLKEKDPDNYLWSFIVENKINRTAPYIEKVNPGLDVQGINGFAPLEVYFSENMWGDTLFGIKLTEYPANLCYESEKCLDNIWFKAWSNYSPLSTNSKRKAVAIVAHREFGPNHTDLYYFPSVPSTVKSDYQNCLYPGRGPVPVFNGSVGIKGDSPQCAYEVDNSGEVIDNGKCVLVNYTATTDSGCIQTVDKNLLLQPDISTCQTKIINETVSPRQ